MYYKLQSDDAHKCNIVVCYHALLYAEREDVTVRGRFLRRSFRPSVTFMYAFHAFWNTWTLISRSYCPQRQRCVLTGLPPKMGWNGDGMKSAERNSTIWADGAKVALRD